MSYDRSRTQRGKCEKTKENWLNTAGNQLGPPAGCPFTVSFLGERYPYSNLKLLEDIGSETPIKPVVCQFPGEPMAMFALIGGRCPAIKP